jgi:POLQ-like helicase
VLVYGAMADICEGKFQDKELVELLHYLQNALKVGLKSKLGLWLYSKGYVDREVCKSLVQALSNDDIAPENFSKKILSEKKEIIKLKLDSFPGYFSNL